MRAPHYQTGLLQETVPCARARAFEFMLKIAVLTMLKVRRRLHFIRQTLQMPIQCIANVTCVSQIA